MVIQKSVTNRYRGTFLTLLFTIYCMRKTATYSWWVIHILTYLSAGSYLVRQRPYTLRQYTFTRRCRCSCIVDVIRWWNSPGFRISQRCCVRWVARCLSGDDFRHVLCDNRRRQLPSRCRQLQQRRHASPWMNRPRPFYETGLEYSQRLGLTNYLAIVSIV